MLVFAEIAVVVALLQADSLAPGDHHRKLQVAGTERDYFVHIPKAAPESGERAVVLAFHGGGSNAENMIDFSGLNETSDLRGFIVVYPNGTGRLGAFRTFNGGECCGYAMQEKVDDVRFTAELLDDLRKLIPFDDRRVYATGMSNGAILSYRLASELSDRIAAVAPVGGPMGTEKCAPRRAVPVCHFHGTRDEHAPYAGGTGKHSISRTNFRSVEYSIAQWVEANQCDRKPLEETLPQRVDDGTSVKRSTYSGGKNGAEVVLYTIEGMGHTWPGRKTKYKILGPTTANISANDAMWEFFSRHALPERAAR